MNRETGKGRRKGNRGRPPDPLERLSAFLDLSQRPLNPMTSATTSGSNSGSLSQCQLPPGPLQPITRFCRPQDTNTPGAASSAHSFMDKRLMAQVLRLLKDASPSMREQLIWDVFTQLAEYFGQPYPPLRRSPNYPRLSRLSPSPWNQVTLYDPNLSSWYQQQFEEVEVLGRGGFGYVVKAKNRLDGCFYAIKIIAVDDKGEPSPNKKLEEVRALAPLNHPHVVRYHNAWLQPDHPFPGTPWTPMAARDPWSDVSDGTEEEATTESSPDMNNEENGTSPGMPSLRQDNHGSGDDDIVFQSSGAGHGQGHSGQQPRSGRVSGTGEGAASKALLPYSQPQMVLCPRKVLYIQMGLCGESLKEWLEKRNKTASPVNHCRCLGFFRELVEALSYIHGHCIIHRDIKPANIFFTLKGNHIQLGDFGLAKHSAAPSSLSPGASNQVTIRGHKYTSNVGTPLYAAPEVKNGKYDEKSDMFSMGIVLLELISIFSTSHERIDMIEGLRIRRHLDPEIARTCPIIAHWILTLTDPEPANRPSSEELLASSLFAQPHPPPPPLPPPSTEDTTSDPVPAPPDPEPANGGLLLNEAISSIKNFQSEVNGIGTLKLSPIKEHGSTEVLKINHVTVESSVKINTIERHLSKDEEIAVLREDNSTLKKRVEELELEILRLKATDSASSTLRK